MKLKVLKPFINKENKKQIFEAGTIIDIDDVARINDIVKRGLGEIIIERTEEEHVPVGDDAYGDQPKEDTPAKGETSKGKTKKTKEEQPIEEAPADGETAAEQPVTGEVSPAESEDADEKEE